MTHPTMPPRTAPPVADRVARLAEDALIALDPRTDGLGEGDATWIRRWVRNWLPHASDAIVVMGCVGPRPRAVRVRALRQLRDALAGCGVPEERIRFTGEALTGSALHTTRVDHDPRPPSAAAWLKVLPAREAELNVRSIRSLFESATPERRSACTSAS